MQMRKIDRSIPEFDNIIKLLDQCDTVRIALNGDPYPYVVPVSFGYEVAEGKKLTLYFHGAGEGKKHEMIAKDNHVCIEADILRGYRPTGHSVTADYKSVIGFGIIEKVTDFEEKVKGIQLLLDHCKTEGYSARDCALAPITVVYKITLDTITGKQRFTE